MCREPLVIAGDFNFHLDDVSNSESNKFLELLETFSPTQHVLGSTHSSGHTLDLIVTRSSDDIISARPQTTFPISDHYFIQCPVAFPRPARSVKEVSFRKLKNIDIAAFSSDISTSVLYTNDVWNNISTFSDCYNSTLADILNKHASLKSITVIDRWKVPWFNDEIKKLKCNAVALRRKLS